MSIIENLEKWTTTPDQFLWELLKVERYKRSATVTILTLIEQKQRETNKNQVFKELQPQWIRCNEEQKENIKDEFWKIQEKFKEFYGIKWPKFLESCINEIIRNLVPDKAEDIIEARDIIQKDLAQTNS